MDSGTNQTREDIIAEQTRIINESFREDCEKILKAMVKDINEPEQSVTDCSQLNCQPPTECSEQYHELSVNMGWGICSKCGKVLSAENCSQLNQDKLDEDDTKDKLKPCPFCGNEVKVMLEHYAHCNSCETSLRLDIWNKRACYTKQDVIDLLPTDEDIIKEFLSTDDTPPIDYPLVSSFMVNGAYRILSKIKRRLE